MTEHLPSLKTTRMRTACSTLRKKKKNLVISVYGKSNIGFQIRPCRLFLSCNHYSSSASVALYCMP
jgi:hypothetical protein